jgi:hypothetical protein
MTFEEWWTSDWGKDTIPPNTMQDFKDALRDAYTVGYDRGESDGYQSGIQFGLSQHD